MSVIDTSVINIPRGGDGNVHTRAEFSVHKLNEAGLAKAAEMANAFSACLDRVEAIAGVKDTGRELAIVRTKLQEASFFAKQAISIQKEHQAT